MLYYTLYEFFKANEVLTMQILIQLSLSLVGGLLMSRLAKRLNLPAVTAYLITGLLLGPYCLGGLNLLELGFNTPQEVSSLRSEEHTSELQSH